MLDWSSPQQGVTDRSPPFCGIQGAGFVRSGEGKGVLMIFVRILMFVASRGQTWL